MWSPDGSKIAYSSEAAGTADIWVKSVTGGGEAELVFDDEALKYPTSWSSDGRYLLFESWGSSGGCDTYALDLEEGGEPIALHDSEFVDRAPMISPNGRWVLYMSDESGDPEVYVTAFPEVGRKWQISSSNPMVARWAGNNEIFMVDTEGVIRVAEVNGEGETFGVGPVEESPITTGPFSWFSFDVTVDRDRLLVMKPTGDDSGRARMDPLTLVLNWTADLERR